MVDVPGVDCRRIRCFEAFVPVIGYLMIVNDVQPGQRVRDRGPVWGRIDLAIFMTVSLDIRAVAMGYVDVDKVAEKKHELRMNSWNPFCQML